MLSPRWVPVLGLATIVTTAQAQLAPNMQYDGRLTMARLKYTPVANPIGCQGADSPAGPGWGHDYPMSVQGLLTAVRELTSSTDVVADSNLVLTIEDPEINKHPVLMLTEPGCWNPTEAEAKALREYLTKGGFMIVDDATYSDATPEHMDLAVQVFEEWMRRVLPWAVLVRIPESDPVFGEFFEVKAQGMVDESDGAVAEIRGIYEDNDPTKRLMVVANYRAAIGQFWRYANGLGSGLGTGSASLAYKLGLNYVIYGMTH